MDCIDDIIKWSSEKLSNWKQDALRRIACNDSLTDEDRASLLAMVKAQVGFSVEAETPVGLDRSHFAASGATGAFHIKKIHKVNNVNRLVPSAELNFEPTGLTIIYGRNGSGKSGFVRIFRTACRTRTENAAKLKVLGDVYETQNLPIDAEIVIEKTGTEVAVPWVSGGVLSPDLTRVAVFDSTAAAVYVDGGHHIQFLPFGLALPHKLNELCLVLKAALEAERQGITQKLALLAVPFPDLRTTPTQVFYAALSANTKEAEIDRATHFSETDENRLKELVTLLTAPQTSAGDIMALAAWVQPVSHSASGVSGALTDELLTSYMRARQAAETTRQLANLGADALFSDEPLPGVGAEAWRALWLAAKAYSMTDAYVGKDFPVVNTREARENCVLCQQELDDVASDRLSRFSAFVSGELATSAAAAQAHLAATLQALPTLEAFQAKDWSVKVAQIASRNSSLATRLETFKTEVIGRYAQAVALLSGARFESKTFAPLLQVDSDLQSLSNALATEAGTLASLAEGEERQKLIAERAELQDRKLLSGSIATVKAKVENLKLDALYGAALAEVQTVAITKKANELLDTYLTTEVIEAFRRERESLDVSGLKIALSRRSDPKKASFQTETGSVHVKNSSEILSEGEQRSLALAGFFTEITVSEGKGPIIIDDPVSSLDRMRGVRVAKRIVQEAVNRQVIVFTHDLVFFNELHAEAEAIGVPVHTQALFADARNAGRIDPAGIAWKGLPVAKRLHKIHTEFQTVKALATSSPTQYEFEVKNLYGRLRDTYERLVEEHVFHDIVRRGVDAVQTLKLRLVHLSDDLAIRFHVGMTKANTYSHDNPASETVHAPAPDEFLADISAIEALAADLKAESKATEARRPAMKP